MQLQMQLVDYLLLLILSLLVASGENKGGRVIGGLGLSIAVVDGLGTSAVVDMCAIKCY